MNRNFVLCLVLCCGCGNDEESNVNLDSNTTLFEALRSSDTVHVGALTEERDAGLGSQFHDAILRSRLVEASNEVTQELVELLSTEGSYMDGDNACFNYDVALQLDGSGDTVDIIVGLTCNNIAFFLNGVRTGKYMKEGPIVRLAQLTHEVVPAIDATAPLD
jgi:hypothetical protein